MRFFSIPTCVGLLILLLYCYALDWMSVSVCIGQIVINVAIVCVTHTHALAHTLKAQTLRWLLNAPKDKLSLTRNACECVPGFVWMLKRTTHTKKGSMSIKENEISNMRYRFLCTPVGYHQRHSSLICFVSFFYMPLWRFWFSVFFVLGPFFLSLSVGHVVFVALCLYLSAYRNIQCVCLHSNQKKPFHNP